MNEHARQVFPALRCSMGDWWYYITFMRFSDIAYWIKNVDEVEIVHANKHLSQLTQRELRESTWVKGIVAYLTGQEERFFNSIVAGVYGGDPKWYPIEIGKSSALGDAPIDEDARNSVGLLMLDGKEQIFAIDGQHRVEGIRQALKIKEALNSEEQSVLFVTHKTTAEGRKRTRRLFTTLNKHVGHPSQAADTGAM